MLPLLLQQHVDETALWQRKPESDGPSRDSNTKQQNLVTLVSILFQNTVSEVRLVDTSRLNGRTVLCRFCARNFGIPPCYPFILTSRFVCHLDNTTARIPLFTGQAFKLGRTLQEIEISISIYRPIHLTTSSIYRRQIIDMFVISNITFHMRSVLFIRKSKITRAVTIILFVSEKDKKTAKISVLRNTVGKGGLAT